MAGGKVVIVKPKKKASVPPPVKAYVNKQISKNTENKFIYERMTVGFNSVSTAWSERQMNAITEGDDNMNRSGRQIKILSIEIRGVIATGTAESLADDPYNYMRVILGLYNGGAPTPLTSATLDIRDPCRVEQGTRGYMIKKYIDRYIPLEVTSTEKGDGDGYTPQLKVFKYYKRFKKGIYVSFGDNTVNYPNKMFILSMASDSTAVPNPGFITGYWLLTFEDA